MSRAQKLLEHLIRRPKSDLRACTRAVGLDPDDADDRNRIATQLSQLGKAKKVTRTGAFRNGRYSATPDALIDFRVQPRKTAPAADQQKPARAQVVRAVTQTQPPVPPQDSPTRESLSRLFQTTPRKPGVLTSDDIAADIADFVRKGGAIQHLANGATSQPLRISMDEVHDRIWRQHTQAAAEEATARTKSAAVRRRDTLDDQEADDDEVAA